MNDTIYSWIRKNCLSALHSLISISYCDMVSIWLHFLWEKLHNKKLRFRLCITVGVLYLNICIQTYHKSFKIFSRLHSIWHIWHILRTKILHWELVNAVLCDQERKLLIGKEIRSGVALRWHVDYAISKDLKINFIATKLYFSNIG